MEAIHATWLAATVASGSQAIDRMTKLPMALFILSGLCGTSVLALADGTLTGRVTDLNEQPVGDAVVVITGTDGIQTRTMTDPTGHYAATVPGGGSYAVVFSFGRAHVNARLDIPVDGTLTLNTRLEVGGEVIEITGQHQPVIYAKPKSDPLAIPPYSDKAVLGDHWAKAWLLLDVDDHGVVTRAKFLKRPGYELDEIAVKHVFGMRFDPARDHNGVPAPSFIVWPLEWPSLNWLQARGALANRLPTVVDRVHTVPGGLVVDGYPPCLGSGPLELSALHPVARDCTIPDLSRGDASELWYVRDSRVRPPEVADAPPIDPRVVRDHELEEANRNRTTAIGAAVAAGGLTVATVLAYTQLRKASDRLDADQASGRFVDVSTDQARLGRWELGTAALLTGAAVSAIASVHFWSHSSVMTLQPMADGGAMSYAGTF